MEKSAKGPVFGVAAGVDPELRAIHISILNLYNREITALLCFFIALGKEQDSDFVALKNRFIAFDVCGKILPRELLPPVA